MGKVVLWGGAVGSAVGLLVGLLLALVLFGTDDIPDFADREDLPIFYAIAAIIGLVVGLVVGIAGLAVGRGVAATSIGTAERRRAYGAGAGGATAGALSLFTTSPVLAVQATVAFVLLALIAAAATWWLLPSVVALDVAGATRAAPGALPAWGSTAPQASPMSQRRRVVVTAVAAALAAFVGGPVLVSVVTGTTDLERGADAVVATVVLLAVFAATAWFVWRATGRSGAPGAPDRPVEP